MKKHVQFHYKWSVFINEKNTHHEKRTKTATHEGNQKEFKNSFPFSPILCLTDKQFIKIFNHSPQELKQKSKKQKKKERKKQNTANVD